MSIFNIFNSKSDSKKEVKQNITWHQLTQIEQLDEISELSKTTIVGIFKHSTRCVISKGVLKQFEEKFSSDLPIKMYYLDLLNYREISNKIAERFQVIHQSPQLLIIKNTEAIRFASHYDIITDINLEEIVKK